MEPALLDTDMLSELWKLRDPIVQQHALHYQSVHGAFAFSAMTRYEVLRGYRRHGAANQEARFEIFCRHSLVLPITNAILDRAADLWAHAHRQGVARNDADLIIAATALEHGRTLVTGKKRTLRLDRRADHPRLATARQIRPPNLAGQARSARANQSPPPHRQPPPNQKPVPNLADRSTRSPCQAIPIPRHGGTCWTPARQRILVP